MALLAPLVALAVVIAMTAARPLAAGESLAEQVIDALRRDYVQPHRLDPHAMLEGALERVSQLYPSVVLEVRETGLPWIRLQVGRRRQAIRRSDVSDLDELAIALVRVRNFIGTLPHPGVMPRSDPAETLETHLIDGMLTALDRHSRFFTPRRYRNFQDSASGKFGGIGVIVSDKAPVYRILAVMPDSPASRAGLLAGDVIVEVEARSALEMEAETLVQLMRGPAGVAVRLTIARGEKGVLHSLSVTRGRIELPSVESHRFSQSRGRHIAYVRLSGFHPTTMKELRTHLERMAVESVRSLGLILDMRNNPGGMLDQAIRVSDLFLERGVIVKTVRARGEPYIARARGYRAIHTVPLVVLIDQDSASAAEIVAAALRNNNRAVVLGTRSYGKGTVQTVNPLSGGYALKLTMAKYLTPGDRSIQWIGVTPHIYLHPVSLGARLNLLPAGVAFEPGRERGGFGEDGFPPEQPLATVNILENEETPALVAGLPLPKNRARRHELLSADPPLRLARRILDRNARRGFSTLMDTMLAVAEEEQRRQEAAIVSRLRGMGVDWRAPSPAGQGSAELERVEVLLPTAEGWRTAPGDVPPGERFRVKLTVRNGSDLPVARLLGTVGSLSGNIATRQVAIGYLVPGAARVVTVDLFAPATPGERIEPMQWVLRSDGRRISEEKFFIPVRGGNAPVFTAHLTFTEKGGSGNGRMGAGERLRLRIRVVNGSDSPSPPALLVLSGQSGLAALPRTHARVEPIGAGRSRQYNFPIQLARRPKSGKAVLVFRMLDGKSRNLLLEKPIVLKLGAAPPRLTLHPPDIELEPHALAVAGESPALRGVVVDDGEPRDILLWVNGRKVFYHDGGPGPRDEWLHFGILPHLEPGYNTLVLEARDNENLVSRRRFGIWKGSMDGFPIAGPARAQGE